MFNHNKCYYCGKKAITITVLDDCYENELCFECLEIFYVDYTAWKLNEMELQDK